MLIFRNIGQAEYCRMVQTYSWWQPHSTRPLKPVLGISFPSHTEYEWCICQHQALHDSPEEFCLFIHETTWTECSWTVTLQLTASSVRNCHPIHQKSSSKWQDMLFFLSEYSLWIFWNLVKFTWIFHAPLYNRTRWNRNIYELVKWFYCVKVSAWTVTASWTSP